MEETLADRDWSMRLRAARWLVAQDPASDALSRIRPAPVTVAADLYEAPRLITPAFSPQVYIDTAKGTVQVELAVLDAPLTVENFIALARKGYFDGLQIHRVVPAFVVQDGDPRGDGSGGPGYSIRDELNDRAVRARHGRHGAVGARHRRQPVVRHACAAAAPRRAVHGVRPGGAGDGRGRPLEVGDTITRMRVWDGVTAPQ